MKRLHILWAAVFTALLGCNLIAWVVYCSANVIDKNPDRAALIIAKTYGGYDETELTPCGNETVFSKEESFPMSALAEQRMVTFAVHRPGYTGKLYLHLYNWTGFGWKLFEYKDATAQSTRSP